MTASSGPFGGQPVVIACVCERAVLALPSLRVSANTEHRSHGIGTRCNRCCMAERKDGEEEAGERKMMISGRSRKRHAGGNRLKLGRGRKKKKISKRRNQSVHWLLTTDIRTHI